MIALSSDTFVREDADPDEFGVEEKGANILSVVIHWTLFHFCILYSQQMQHQKKDKMKVARVELFKCEYLAFS